jgi:hypothetical protein
MSGIYRVIGRERNRLRVSMALMTVGCPCCRVHGWSGVLASTALTTIWDMAVTLRMLGRSSQQTSARSHGAA